MKTQLAVAITSLMGFTALADLPPKFVRAIHMVESSGRYGKIDGDNFRAKGPLQIHESYYRDAKAFKPSIGGTYNDCYNFDYSVKVMTAYMERYGMKYIQKGNWEALARLHNQGVGWEKNPAKTDAYCLKFRKEYNKLRVSGIAKN